MTRRQAKRKKVGVKEQCLRKREENKDADVYNDKIDRQNELREDRERKRKWVKKNRKKRERERLKRKAEKEKEKGKR